MHFAVVSPLNYTANIFLKFLKPAMYFCYKKKKYQNLERKKK